MQEYKENSLENQITSMLKQIMEEENRNQNQENLFFSDNEEEDEEKSNLNYQKRETCFKDDEEIINNHFNQLSNNFIRKNQRKEKKFQTVNFNDNNSFNNFNNPYYYNHRNYFQTQIIQNPLYFNFNLQNSIPNNFFVQPNYLLNNRNLNQDMINNINNYQRSSKRKKTYDAKIENHSNNNEIRDNNKKFGTAIFPKDINLKLEILFFELKNILYRTDKIDHYIYNKIQGNIAEIIKSHKGSRIFQNYLKNTHNDILHQIFMEINPFLNELLIDPYANYFCKKFFTFLNQKDRIDFLNTIKNSLIKLSSNNIGTFPIQGIIEHVGSKIEKNIIINSIKNNIHELSINPFSCHVIEKILSCFEEKYISFIYDYISKNFLFLAYNVNGICLIKRIVSFTHKKNLHEQIKKIVEENSMELIVHPNGNYVIQELVESWDLNEVKQSLLLYKNKLTMLSMEKYSSNVIEKYIEKSDDILNEFINEIIFQGKISEIMKSNFGNFVIQKAIKLSSGENKRKLIIEVSKNIYKLNDKKLIIKWKDLILKDLKNL